MIRLIRKFFGLCDHTYTDWTVIKEAYSPSWGVVRIIQARKCTKCGYVKMRTMDSD
jgi:hypothetical protein